MRRSTRVTSPRSVRRATCSCKSDGAFCVTLDSIADLRKQPACDANSRRFCAISRDHNGFCALPSCAIDNKSGRYLGVRFMLRLFGILLFATISLAAQRSSFAEESYPVRPVRLIVGFAAGSSGDVAARIVSRKIGDLLGQTIIVENRPGASSMLAT